MYRERLVILAEDLDSVLVVSKEPQPQNITSEQAKAERLAAALEKEAAMDNREEGFAHGLLREAAALLRRATFQSRMNLIVRAEQAEAELALLKTLHNAPRP